VADPRFQHRVFPKINSIQRYEKYTISTHIYQYILDFSIEKQVTRVFPEIPGINAGSTPAKNLNIPREELQCLLPVSL
jgi:hypothetical protein